MKFKINYRLNFVLIGRAKFPLDILRAYLLSYHPDLCHRNFVKAIKTPSGTLFTYDWENIFFVARTTSILTHFVAHTKKLQLA